MTALSEAEVQDAKGIRAAIGCVGNLLRDGGSDDPAGEMERQCLKRENDVNSASTASSFKRLTVTHIVAASEARPGFERSVEPPLIVKQRARYW